MSVRDVGEKLLPFNEDVTFKYAWTYVTGFIPASCPPIHHRIASRQSIMNELASALGFTKKRDIAFVVTSVMEVSE